MRNIALIPARGGSQRIPNKNAINLLGHPMIAYTIATALASSAIDEVLVSTDSEEIKEISEKYGARVPGMRPPEISGTESSDLQWIKHAIESWLEVSSSDKLIILRPTNPLRKRETIEGAMDLVSKIDDWHSLRAVRPVKEHPSKVWRRQGAYITPYNPELNQVTGTDSHSSPMQTLEPLYVQDASLEICKVSTILETNSISGTKVIPFEMPGSEGFDINLPGDLDYLKHLLDSGKASLPPITQKY